MKIGIVSTGGTIGSTKAKETFAMDSGALSILFGVLENLFPRDEFVYHQPLNLFSEDFEPKHWFELAGSIIDIDREDDCDGYLVLHGTDTMTYTANALSILLSSSGFYKPVVLTGSRVPADQVDSDALQNMIDATACLEHLKSGVVVLFGQAEETASLIYDPRYCRKDSFDMVYLSVNMHTVGSISNRVLYKNDDYLKHDPHDFSGLDIKDQKLQDVDPKCITWIKVHPGISENSFKDLGNKIVILEGYASFTMPQNIADILNESNLLVVFVVTDGSKEMPSAKYPSLKKLENRVLLSCSLPETVYVNTTCAAALIDEEDKLVEYLSRKIESSISF